MRVFILLLAVMGVFLDSKAFAQPQAPAPAQRTPRPDRPYRGLFGGGVTETAQLLTLGLNIGGGYDSSVLVDDRETSDPLMFGGGRTRSSFGQASAKLDYTMNRSKLDFSATAMTAASYYPVLPSPIVPRHSASIGGQYRVSPKTNLSASYSVTYRPVRHLTILPDVFNAAAGPINPLDTVLGTSRESYRSLFSSVNVTQELSRRVGLSVGFRTWESRSSIDDRDLSSLYGTAGVSIGLTKDVGMRVGYRYGRGRFAAIDNTDINSPIIHSHSVDFGLDFRKALSLTRRTTLSFGTGTAGLTDGRSSTSFTLTGNVDLAHDIGRTWQTSLGYNRDARFVETFRQPVVRDSLLAGFGGLINRRISLDTGTGVTKGKVGITGEDNQFTAFHSSAGLGIGITRNLNFGIRYSYARYRFDDSVDLPLDLRFQNARHGVHADLSTWLPLFQRARRP